MDVVKQRHLGPKKGDRGRRFARPHRPNKGFNVAPRAKGFAARAPDDDGADAGVARPRGVAVGHAGHDGQVERVEGAGTVQGDDGDGGRAGEEDLKGRGGTGAVRGNGGGAAASGPPRPATLTSSSTVVGIAA